MRTYGELSDTGSRPGGLAESCDYGDPTVSGENDQPRRSINAAPIRSGGASRRSLQGRGRGRRRGRIDFGEGDGSSGSWSGASGWVELNGAPAGPSTRRSGSAARRFERRPSTRSGRPQTPVAWTSRIVPKPAQIFAPNRLSPWYAWRWQFGPADRGRLALRAMDTHLTSRRSDPSRRAAGSSCGSGSGQRHWRTRLR